MDNLEYLAKDIEMLSIFRKVEEDEIISALWEVLKNKNRSKLGEFAFRLLQKNDDLTEYVLSVILNDENIYLLNHAQMKEIPSVINDNAHKELALLEDIAKLTPSQLRDYLGYDGYVPEWNTSDISFISEYSNKMALLSTEGYGIFSQYSSFRYENGKIVPVRNPDPQSLEQLSGYENERKKVIDNTKALLRGKPALNTLLYGDAGTGKSSTVKAVLNRFSSDGLRLIELKKSQLHELPTVIDEIALNPLKFIIFIDDLSFASDDDDFGALKAVLEGSASAKTPNTVIYATSNRRHLVKEKFSERDGDEIHRRDSMEETISLSERFGLKVSFSKPNKDLYLQIVENLAEEYGLEYDRDELFTKAEAYALRRAGRSGRAAKHFIEMMLSEKE